MSMIDVARLFPRHTTAQRDGQGNPFATQAISSNSGAKPTFSVDTRSG
jgi:hypothetical protein